MIYSESISYYIIDLIPFHKVNDTNIKKSKVSVKKYYKNQKITPDFVPRGYLKYNPVE
jgi:hypothetical protein